MLPNFMAEKLIINYEDYKLAVEKLALTIEKNYKPSVLVGIMRGAAPIIDMLSRIFKLPTAYVVIQSYSGETVENKQGELIFARDGTWNQQDTWHGLKEGMVAMGPYNSAMGADLVKEVEQLQKDLASGKVHSFTGPIYDQKGNILVAEGKVADDGMLAGMSVYVKGVEGDIPK